MATTDEPERTLEIDGETVVFEIETVNNVASGYIPTPSTNLVYRVLGEDGPVREGTLQRDVASGPVSRHFADAELRGLYRALRGR